MSLQNLEREYKRLADRGIQLDLTRGKPGPSQVALADALDGILQGDFQCSDGTDARNYGGLRGIPECRELGAVLTGFPADCVIAGGNSSLQLMYLVADLIVNHGLAGSTPIRDRNPAALCLVPGYDRHFTLTSALGVQMLAVTLADDGPDMAQVEAMVAADPSIAFIWCVPKHSNPTGCTYSADVVNRMATLPALRGTERPLFVLWDNAYSVHDFGEVATELSSIYDAANASNTLDRVVAFASTSKITHAGAGVAFVAGSERTLSDIEKHLNVMTVGYDKVNQLRHARFLKDAEGIEAHMAKHAKIVKPLFDTVESGLQHHLGNTGLAKWTQPTGGYFVSLDLSSDFATEVVELASSIGLKLTAAGATYPYGKDPMNANIRIAPTYANRDDIEIAMEVLGLSVQLAAARRQA